MVGMSPGNGHPFSFSAILNGYDPQLLASSPYPTIYEYMRRQPPEAQGIEDARVTHVWAADSSAAEYVARTCRIPQVVRRYEEMLGEVDAVILPHDDGALHLEMARPFLRAGLPVFIDKPLADTVEDARALVKMAGRDGLLMSCSALRYSAEVEALRRALPQIGDVHVAHGVSWRSWMKYGVHLVEAIYAVLGRGIVEVQNMGAGGEAVVHCKYANGPHVVLHVFEHLSPLIQVGFFGTRGYRVVDAADWFAMFRNTLAHFVAMIKQRQRPIPLEETLEITSVMIAGQRSLERGGAPVRLNGASIV